MSKFSKDNKAIMGLTLSQIGLVIATAIILVAVFNVIFNNDWQRNAELESITDSFSTIVEGMDTRFFENTTTFRFPDKNYYYNISLSTEYIVASSQGFLNNQLSIKERFLIKPWPQKQILNPDWVTGEELHDYLTSNYVNAGTELDPIQPAHIIHVKDYLNSKRDITNVTLAEYPFYIKTNQTVYIEKVIIYYDLDGDGWDKTIDERQDFILIYQLN